jgi:hypothetical protein
MEDQRMFERLSTQRDFPHDAACLSDAEFVRQDEAQELRRSEGAAAHAAAARSGK